MQKATVGRIVHVLVDPAQNNGCDVATGIVARTWGDPFTPSGVTSTSGIVAPGLPDTERQTINVRVLGDNAETLWLTSILLFAERPTDEQLTALNQYNPKGYRAVAFWPPREG